MISSGPTSSAQSVSVEPSKPPYRILIIEDELDISTLTRRIIEKTLPCSISAAYSGDSGMAELARGPFDLVITDMRLPGVHGLELIESIRTTYPDTSIIVMTGFTDAFPYVEAVDAGADDFLAKPFQTAELQAKVLRVIRERELRQANAVAQKKYRSLFESSSEGMALLDGRSLLITDANQACCDLVGRTSDALRGQPFAELLGRQDADRFMQWLALCTACGRGTIGDLQVHTPDGRTLVVDISLTFLEVGTESIALIACKDVTERHEIHRRLADAAQKDKLSGLFNKSAFDSRIAWAVAKARQQEAGLVLMMIDLDNFKQCNDKYGHQIGDQLLAQVGKVIQGSIRTQLSDEGFRCGGDEFAVILGGTSFEGGIAVAERMLQQFRSIETYGASMSIGMAVFTPDLSAEALVKKADTALYAAKSGGKDKVHTA
jgi:diguanylate cyclase (GGDEF)-like protein/PAS domain S-box-containing protein